MPNYLYAETKTVATKPQPKREPNWNKLREMVLFNIGTPDDLDTVEIKKLHSDSHFRVNIYRIIKEKRTMTDSYYVYLTPDGPMSMPAMDKKYHDADLAELWLSMSEEKQVAASA